MFVSTPAKNGGGAAIRITGLTARHILAAQQAAKPYKCFLVLK
jgi:hypothetical protein